MTTQYHRHVEQSPSTTSKHGGRNQFTDGDIDGKLTSTGQKAPKIIQAAQITPNHRYEKTSSGCWF